MTKSSIMAALASAANYFRSVGDAVTVNDKALPRPTPKARRRGAKGWGIASKPWHALRVYSILGVCGGGRHYWLDTNHGRIRKPAGTFPMPEGY